MENTKDIIVLEDEVVEQLEDTEDVSVEDVEEFQLEDKETEISIEDPDEVVDIMTESFIKYLC